MAQLLRREASEKNTWRVSAGEGAGGGERHQEAEHGDQQQTREHRLEGEQAQCDVLWKRNNYPAKCID